MHDAAKDFVRSVVTKLELAYSDSVLEIGSRDVNGSVRDLFVPTVDYFGIDVAEGEGVDLVADGARWEPDKLYDVAICTEVLEHAAEWRLIVATMAKALRPGGTFIITCATYGRMPHSAIDGGSLRHGEYYGNVSQQDLGELISSYADDTYLTVNDPGHGGDLYLVARRKKDQEC